MRVIAFLSLLALGTSVGAAEPHKLEQLWLSEGLRTPESVLFYQTENETVLLVSEIEGDGTAVDGKGGIAKLSTDGKIINQNWVRGLNAPKGLAYLEDLLYVADITEVVEIRISTGEILRKIPVADSVFLNDVSVNSRGEVFVSDTRTNKVHRIIDGKVETWLENIEAANGLKALGSNLVIGAGDTLWLADKDKNLRKLAEGFAAQIDGIEMAAPSEFLVSCWVGLLYYVHSDGRVELLIDSREQKINTADIGYDAEHRIVYVPNFFKDSVTTYQLR